MSSPTADVNWLLSAIAQASAALVAIVGGLLVSRYVTLHAEQQAAKRRLDDLDRRAGEARSRFKEVDEEWGDLTARNFFEDEDVLEGIFHTLESGEVALDSALLQAGKTDEDFFDRAVYEEHFQEVVAEFQRAVQELYPSVEVQLDAEPWREFKKGKGLAVVRELVWEWVYERIAQERDAEARAERREAFERKYSDGSIRPFYDEPLPRLAPALEGGQQGSLLGLLRDQVSSADAEVRALEQERRLAEETFEATRQPEGFSLALQVLSVLSVLGMGIPVTLMTSFPVTTLPWWGRTAVAVVFFLGVYLLLRFLFVYASYLRGATESLPKNAWSLLTPRRRKKS